MQHDTSDRSILWRRLDQPGHEFAQLRRLETGWQLAGVAVFAHQRRPCRLDYLVACDDRWHTVSAQVSGWVGDRPVATRLAVDSTGRWWLNGAECPAVAGCIDLDLNFSPVTNLLPIRRLDLAIGAAAEVRAAWLRFPSFALEPLDQVYRHLDATTYRYESAGGRFVADLTVNTVGFVTTYPNLWQVEAEV
ncbi:MAG TPA: putative glycolipid-binding domain-containing protein [Roseiflexaceae bacterium]|nr:putative glycolipid-binding domain-containing protein [Roseiflexaceae bacterium]